MYQNFQKGVIMQHKVGSVAYMAVTADEYELPLVVTDTVIELAEKLNLKPQSVSSSICRNLSGRKVGYKIVRVKL